MNITNIISKLMAIALLASYVLVIPANADEPDNKAMQSLIENAAKGDAVANYTLGANHFNLDTRADYDKALKYFLIARKAYFESAPETQVWAAEADKAIGDIHEKRSEYARANEYYNRSIALFKKLNKFPLGYSLALQAKALNYQRLSRYKQSIPLLLVARLGMIKLHGSESTYVGDTYLNEGISWESLNKFKKALDTYGTALKIYTKANGEDSATAAYAMNNIAWVHRRLKDFDKSNRWFRRALPILEKHEGLFSRNVGLVKINIGIVQQQMGNHDAAVRWTMRAMPYIKANPVSTLDEQRWAFDTLAKAFKSKDNPARAITFAKLAVNAQQNIRSLNKSLKQSETKDLRSEWKKLYRHLADLLIEEGRINEAQAVLNMEKEQEVYEFLKRDATADLRKTRAILNDSEVSEEQKIQAIAKMPVKAALELSLLRKKISGNDFSTADEDRMLILQDSIQITIDDYEKDIDAFLKSVSNETGDAQKAQIEASGAYQDFLSEFDRRAAILQIASISDATHLFLTLPEITIHKKVPITKAELSRLTFGALQSIEARSSSSQQKLKALHDALIKPVRQILIDSKVEVLMLNLDGFIRYVPFAALYDGEKYLIEDFALALYTPAVPTKFQRGKRRSERSAGFGVTAAHPGFSALPGVKKELEAIFQPAKTKGILNGPTRLDKDFTTRNLKRALIKKPAVLHIASHFQLVSGREDDSFLLLGDGRHLALSDFRRKKSLSFRGIDLVTLSACQTARGGGGDGSEIEGFGATVQLSGASSVLASLWPVADAATAKLMQQFYQNLMQQGLDKAEALRQAQISMLLAKSTGDVNVASAERGMEPLDDDESDAPKKSSSKGFAHPYFWSSFLLMGNWL